MDRTGLADMITFNQTLITILVALHAQEQIERTRVRTQWVRPIFLEHQEQGDYGNLFQKLKEDPEKFFNYLRMDLNTFNELSGMLQPYLRRNNWRALCGEERLVITLRFLATGDSYNSVGYAFRVAASTVCTIVKATCNALWDVLQPRYLVSCSAQEFKKISEEFWLLHGMPNCIGAIDGKHVVVQAPNKTGSLYFNYKKSYSMVLLAVVDAHLRFTIVDIGAYGSESDGGIFGRSAFGQDLVAGQLSLPAPCPLPGMTDNEPMPCYIVGDEAFPLKENLMRPFPGRNLPDVRWNFNKRLSKARRTVENAFGVLAARWRIFRRSIIAEEDTIESIIQATVVLHNFLRTKELEKVPSEQRYVTQDQVPGDSEENAMLQNLPRIGNNPGARAIAVREKLARFLNSPQGQMVENA